MVSKKYTKDYRIEPHLGKGGKLRDVAVYCGSYYHFTDPQSKIRKDLLLWLLTEVLAAATLLPPLFVGCAYGHRIYLVLPLVLSLIPVYLVFAALYCVQTAGDHVTREHRDKICNRLPAGSTVQLVLSAVLVICSLIFLIFSSWETVDLCFAALSLPRLAAAVYGFLHRRSFMMEIEES